MKRLGKFLLAFLLILGITTTKAQASSIEDILAGYEQTTQSLVDTAKTYGEDYMESFATMDKETLEFVVDNYVGFQQRAAESFLDYVKNDTLGEYVEITKSSAIEDGEKYVATVTGEFEKTYLVMKVECKLIFGSLQPTDISFSLEDKGEASFGEKMGTAALNTVMGLFTVFVVLMLISYIISLFKYIPALEAKFAERKMKKESADIGAESVTVVETQSDEQEELVDDLELVAVITAAICASTGASADGFVVRSIRKSKRNA